MKDIAIKPTTSDDIPALKKVHEERRMVLEAERSKHSKRMARERAACAQKQDAEMLWLEREIADHEKAVSEKRARFKPQGLAAFLGKVTGVEFARKKLHERQDKKRHAAQSTEREALANAHRAETRLQQRTHNALKRDLDRRMANLKKVEVRELAALEAKFAQQRNRAFHHEFTRTPIELSQAFERAAGRESGRRVEQHSEGGAIPDLEGAFARAAGPGLEEESDNGDGMNMSSTPDRGETLKNVVAAAKDAASVVTTLKAGKSPECDTARRYVGTYRLPEVQDFKDRPSLGSKRSGDDGPALLDDSQGDSKPK